MKVVIDTNILLQAIAHNSRFRLIWNAFLNEKFDLLVTAAILLEYEEKLTDKASRQVAINVTLLIYEAPNARFTNVYYEWNAITADYDDNKFFDAAVAGNADYLVTNDAHFNAAKKLSFPKLNIITGDEFLELIKSMQN